MKSCIIANFVLYCDNNYTKLFFIILMFYPVGSLLVTNKNSIIELKANKCIKAVIGKNYKESSFI